MNHLSLFFVLSILLILSGCATNPPRQISTAVLYAPDNDIQLAEVKASVADYIDTPVRWGGEVMQYESILTDQGNRLIRLEILQRDLNGKARPQMKSDSDGRFVAYLIPSEEKMGSLKEHLVTVAGNISGSEQLTLSNDNTVTLPVIDADDFYVWHKVSHRHNYHGHDHSNVKFEFIFGHPHIWFHFGHRHYYPYRPHTHHHGDHSH